MFRQKLLSSSANSYTKRWKLNYIISRTVLTIINSGNKKRGKTWKCENSKDNFRFQFSHFHALPLLLLSLFIIISIVLLTNEWMCIYIPHISHTVSRRFTILIEWDRTSACKGASGCRYQSIFDLTHPPSPCMKCTMKQQIDHHTGNYAPYSFRQVCGFFNVPCWPCNTEDAGDGAYGL